MKKINIGIIGILFLIFTVSSSSAVTIGINSSDINKTAVISGLPKDTNVQFVLNDGVPVPFKVGDNGIAKYLLLASGNLIVGAVSGGTEIQNLNISLQTISIPTPTPTTAPSGSGDGSSRHGTYPTVTATPNKNQTSATATPTEIQPTVTIVKPTATQRVETTETTVPIEPKKKVPGFEIAIFIAILLVAVYVLRKR